MLGNVPGRRGASGAALHQFIQSTPAHAHERVLCRDGKAVQDQQEDEEQ